MIKYKSIIFGSIGTIVETSNIQRKSFNKAFKKLGLDWYWSVNEYKKLLKKSGGENRLSKYAKEKKIKINTKKLRDLKTEFFNNYLKRNRLKPRAGILSIINFCKKIGANFIVRGIRNNGDFEFEKAIARTNRKLSKIETVFLLTSTQTSFISSTIVRELILNKGNYKLLVPESVKID